MDLRRLGAGEWIAGLGGVALLASVFAPWYGLGLCATLDSNLGSAEPCPTASGWEALAVTDVLLALVAAAGVLLAVVTATQRAPAVPIALGAVVVLIGLVGVLLVLLRVAAVPDEFAGREWGLWLALAGALGILAGALVSIRDARPREAEEARIEFVPAPRP
jgi:hypothetical protein